MYSIVSDLTTGSIVISESWSIGATGASGPPTFLAPNDEWVITFANLQRVEKFKTFRYDALGEVENRYLKTYYRTSRDTIVWTDWLTLGTNITNFPVITATDPLYFDLKFVRSGPSTVGQIKLLEYELRGNLERYLYDGESTVILTPQNQPTIIKPPFIYKVFKLTDIEILSNGVVDVDFTIKWRYSQDYGRTVTEWEPFTKENVMTAKISPIRFFQVEYLLEVINPNVNVDDINLIGDFQNVTLDYTRTNLYGVRPNCNSLILNLVNDEATFPSADSGGSTVEEDECGPQGNGGPNSLLTPTPADECNVPQLTNDQVANLFQPYNIPTATDLLDKLSNDSVQIFGHDVVYFLTDPDKKGIDYTFHEYQLYNYVDNADIKVAVDGNNFPENNGTINQFDLALFDNFEIHITKVAFKQAFGVDKRPAKEDFLWFCKINRMFTVEHAQAFRGFNNNAIYYKVMLRKFNNAANIIGANQTITDKLQSLIRNSTIDELFGKENDLDKLSTANPKQFKRTTTEPIRNDVIVLINRELIENSTNIISKTHYDLTTEFFTATASTDAVIYNNITDYFPVSSNIGFTCWFNINELTMNDNYRLFNYYDDTNSLGIDIRIVNNNVRVKWCDDEYLLPLTGSLQEGVWYAYLLNVDARKRKIAQWIYKRNVDKEKDAKYLNSTVLKQVYHLEETFVPVDFKLENTSAKLLTCDMKLTNIRLFNEVIPISEHTKILNQAIVGDDTRNLIFADNANKRIYLPNYPIGTYGPFSDP